MPERTDDMQGTTMRVRKRTARYVEYLKVMRKMRTGHNISPDDILWEALLNTFGEEIRRADEQFSDQDEEKGN